VCIAVADAPLQQVLSPEKAADAFSASSVIVHNHIAPQQQWSLWEESMDAAGVEKLL
jgi:hypothetical protein